MQYEVEQKFPVADMHALQERLIALGANFNEPQMEVDLYFDHPARDFSKTDEALRIRRRGSDNFITYKGPKIDTTTKTRREIELPLTADEESARSWKSLLEALGFEPVGEVLKWRCKARILWQNQAIECSLDDVQGLGEYCELELLTNFADLEPAKTCIAALADKLGLKQSERRSYLELLLKKQ
jgi:adenylate cyclase, class 2